MVNALKPVVEDKVEKLSKGEMKRKKKEFAEALNLGDPAQLTPEKIAGLAINWMVLVDKDGNNMLSLEEFYDFFSSMEGVFMSDNEIQALFKEFDDSGNGQLSIEEFARAITHAIVPDEPDDDDPEGEEPA